MENIETSTAVVPSENANSQTIPTDNSNAATPAPATIPAENALTSAPTLAQRVVKINKIQFHLQNMANSAIIIGQELIECKKEVGHGNWAIWLEKNFKFNQQTANRFMRVAERFSKLSINAQFSSTQMITMLALPAREEEKFIAEKAAECTPVEDMTVKKLHEEIKNWKAEAEKNKKESQKYKAESEEKAAEIENQYLQKLKSNSVRGQILFHVQILRNFKRNFIS